jgi:hypothetical protein
MKNTAAFDLTFLPRALLCVFHLAYMFGWCISKHRLFAVELVITFTLALAKFPLKIQRIFLQQQHVAEEHADFPLTHCSALQS